MRVHCFTEAYRELLELITEAVDPKYTNISADDFNSMPDEKFYRFWEPYLRMLAKKIYKANYVGGHDNTYDVNLIEDLVQLGRIKLFKMRRDKKLVNSKSPYAYIRLELASTMKRGGGLKAGSRVMPHWVVGTSHKNWDQMALDPDMKWDRQMMDLLPANVPDNEKRQLLIDLVEYSGLGELERNAVNLVLGGRNVEEMSKELGLSAYKVETLLKAAAEKVNAVAAERGYASAGFDYELPDETKADALHDVGGLQMNDRNREVLSLYQSGMSQADIARKLGVSKQNISIRLNNLLSRSRGEEVPKKVKPKAEVKPRVAKAVTPKKINDTNDRIADLVKSGMDESGIGKSLNLSTLDVMRRVNAMKRGGLL